MALNGNKTLKVSNAHFYWKAESGAAAPSTLDASAVKAAGYEDIGHSSISNILASSTEGGETTTLGSIQNPALRQSTTAAIRSFTVNLLQWDDLALKLFYGANTVIESGKISIPQTPNPSEGTWLAVLEDGENKIAIHAAKCSAIGDGDMSIADSDSLAELPVKFTPIALDDSISAFDFILSNNSDVVSEPEA